MTKQRNRFLSRTPSWKVERVALEENKKGKGDNTTEALVDKTAGIQRQESKSHVLGNSTLGGRETQGDKKEERRNCDVEEEEKINK